VEQGEQRASHKSRCARNAHDEVVGSRGSSDTGKHYSNREGTMGWGDPAALATFNPTKLQQFPGQALLSHCLKTRFVTTVSTICEHCGMVEKGNQWTVRRVGGAFQSTMVDSTL
jgi:hypothetical protein